MILQRSETKVLCTLNIWFWLQTAVQLLSLLCINERQRNLRNARPFRLEMHQIKWKLDWQRAFFGSYTLTYPPKHTLLIFAQTLWRKIMHIFPHLLRPWHYSTGSSLSTVGRRSHRLSFPPPIDLLMCHCEELQQFNVG